MKILLLTVLFLFSYFKSTSQQTINVVPAFPQLIKFNNVRDFTLSADGKECFFTIQSPLEEVSVIMTMKLRDKMWTEPEVLNFSGTCRDLEPFLSPDGNTMYFASNRSLDGTASIKDFDIWMTNRNIQSGEWSTPVNLGDRINSKHNEFYPAITVNKTLYFCSDRPDGAGKDDIYYSVYNDGTYSNPVSVGNVINTDGYEYNAFVAPDESFMIFGSYNRPDGYGSGDNYISFRNNGNWSTPVNLGEPVNSKAMDYCPFLDLKTNTLYFTSRRSNVNQNVNLHSSKEILLEFGKYENGFSRLYKTSFDFTKYKDK